MIIQNTYRDFYAWPYPYGHRCFKVILVFGLFEGLIPGIGFLLGQSLGTVIGNFAFYVGLILIVGLSIYIIVSDDDDEGRVSVKGWALFVSAINMSLDELAVDFSF